ncbi:hypothetical protein JOF41_006680 [Saccharothrix coeruleofusca]|nr:hypothetical protein [Saccharothrix coeruleofusca]
MSGEDGDGIALNLNAEEGHCFKEEGDAVPACSAVA